MMIMIIIIHTNTNVIIIIECVGKLTYTLEQRKLGALLKSVAGGESTVPSLTPNTFSSRYVEWHQITPAPVSVQTASRLARHLWCLKPVKCTCGEVIAATN